MALKRDVTYSGRFNAASTEHPQGEFKNRTSPTSEDGSYLEQQWLNDWDGFMSSLLSENSIVPNGLVDEVGASQYFEGMLRLREVSPRNNDWNGYLDPEHQSSLPAPNGYPGASGGGEVVYTADQEISFGIFAGSGGATVSSDSDGWIFTGSIYKLFDYTTEQLADIDVTTVPVYLKDQDGVESFLKHNGTSVIITKVGSQLKVEITAAIFAGSFTKLWRFFVTERVGRVVELRVVETLRGKWVTKWTGSQSNGVINVDMTNQDEITIEVTHSGATNFWNASGAYIFNFKSMLDIGFQRVIQLTDSNPSGSGLIELYVTAVSESSITISSSASVGTIAVTVIKGKKS